MFKHHFITAVAIVGLNLAVHPAIAQEGLGPITSTTSQTQNARDFFLRADEMLIDKEQIGTKLLPEQERILVERNANALGTVRQGLKLPFPAVDLKQQVEEPAKDFSYEARYRTLARLLATESRVRGASNGYPGAVDSALEAHLLGVKVQYEGPLVAMMTGQAIEQIARRELWALLPKLDAATAKMAARRLEQSEKIRFAFAQSLKVEGDITWLKLLLSEPWSKLPANQKTAAQNHYVQMMTQEIAQASQPFIIYIQKALAPAEILAINKNLIGTWEKNNPNGVPDGGVVMETWFNLTRTTIYVSRFSFERNTAMNSLLLTELARRAYAIENKRDIATLSDLVPTYLHSVPADPFSNNEPLRFIEQDGNKLLYSIGPDGLDNWGMPIEDENNGLKNKYLVQGGSFGDIVSGFNTH